MSKKILFVNSENKNEIEELRMREYANATGFEVNLSTLKWKPSDDESYVLAARIDERVVSTMRAEVIDCITVLEKKLECRWDFPVQLEWPVMVLSRAATLSEHRSSGLNLLLRYWFLQMSMAKDIRYLIGTFVSGSSRENTLREMGYQFFKNQLGWQQSTYRSLRPVVVAVLDMKKNGQQALDYCLQKFGAEIEEYEFDKMFPTLKIVRNL